MTARNRSPRVEREQPKPITPLADYAPYFNHYKREYIERKLGKPLKLILLERFEQYSSSTEVAKSLGVQDSTVTRWLRDCGLVWKLVDTESDNSK